MPRLHALLALALFVFSTAIRAADVVGQPLTPAWRIVVLNGTDLLNPFWLTIDPMLRESIVKAAAPRKVEFLGEALDLVRFPDLETELVPLLKKKYSVQPVDLVIAIAAPALEFAKKYQETLWRGAPIVFALVPTGTVADRSGPSNVTGIYYDFDLDGTLALMARLQPQWNQLLVVGGNAPFDLEWNARLRPHDEHVPKGFAVEYVNDRTPGELAALLAGLPTTAAVLYTSMTRDASGAMHTPREIVGWLAHASAAPVFTMFPPMLGEGIAGGSMISIEDESAAAGKLAVRVLRAGSAEGIPFQASPPARCLLDYRALRRWRIPESAVPDDCEIRFPPQAIWRDYPWQFGASMAAISLLAALVLALLVQRRRRHQADLAVQSLRTTLFHAARLAAVGELTASIAHEINQPLAAILTNTDTARLIIERDPTRVEDLRRILADIRADDLRASAVIRRIRALVTKHEAEPQRIGINDVVGEVLAMLRNEGARRSVAFMTSFDPAAPDVLADRVQLQQVMLNLLINAMDAMADTPASKRMVAASTAVLADRSVEVAVADQGHGIGAADFPRLFVSFWSTKAEGMGLGLPIVQSILEAHGGSIRAENNEHGGATFRFTLPVAPAAPLAPSSVAAEESVA